MRKPFRAPLANSRASGMTPGSIGAMLKAPSSRRNTSRSFSARSNEPPSSWRNWIGSSTESGKNVSSMRTSEAVRIARELRDGARQVRELSTKLEKERSSRRQALTRSFEAELQRARAEHSKALETLNRERDFFAGEQSRRRQERGAWITKALAARKRRLLDRIDEVEGRGKFAVQKGLLDTERSRGEELGATKLEFEQFKENAERWRASFADLRSRFKQTFRGYLGYRGLLSSTSSNTPESSGSEFELTEKVRQLHSQNQTRLQHCRANLLTGLFRLVPIWIWLLLIVAAAFVGPERFGWSGFSREQFTN